MGRSCVILESKDDYKTKKINKCAYKQVFIRVWGTHSEAYLRAYIWHSPNTAPLSPHPLGGLVGFGSASPQLDA